MAGRRPRLCFPLVFHVQPCREQRHSCSQPHAPVAAVGRNGMGGRITWLWPAPGLGQRQGWMPFLPPPDEGPYLFFPKARADEMTIDSGRGTQGSQL